MLKGRVNRYGEPVISIQLILRNRPARLTGVIDTGFNGYLSVPRRLLRRSKWLAIGTEKFEIATGALVEQEIYLGEAIFDGRRGPVYAVSTEAQDILIGTKLLRGKTLTVNFRTKRVTIK
jgi:clan AA aspartic protease